MTSRRRPVSLATTLAALLVLGACGTDGTEGTDRATGQPAGSSASASPTDRSEAATGSGADPEGASGTSKPAERAVPASLDFTATTVAGEGFDGASVAGRPVVLWFWAPWCPTCRGQIPQIRELVAAHGDDVSVLGVGSLDSADAIADFAGDVDQITHLEDVDGELYRRFGVTEQSSFVLLDAAGEVAFRTGYGGSDALADEVAEQVD